jgi:hypothetical protein
MPKAKDYIHKGEETLFQMRKKVLRKVFPKRDKIIFAKTRKNAK